LFAVCFFGAEAFAEKEVHWALRPVRKPEPPKADGRVHNAIDAFIIARLKEKGLSLSSEAKRQILIKRLYIDVIGLAPSIEAVRSFENNDDPEAYGQLVDDLLASPHYGERWARHWLDAVRFAETEGFEMNQPRPNAWPYRDYVIGAFNSDKPYDQFVIEQLAGDIFGADAATGFLVAGPRDQVKSPDPVLTANQRADELHDIISTTGSTFLGLTIGCARCHDHKFDPIPQKDYYALKAVFEGVQHGERKLKTKEDPQKDERLAECGGRLAEIETTLDELEPVAQKCGATNQAKRIAVNPRRNVERFAPVLAKRIRIILSKTTDAEPCIDEFEVYETNGVNVALASRGAIAKASSVYPNSDLHRLEHINDHRYGNSRSWISSERGAGWIELEFVKPEMISKVVWGRDREQKFSDRLATEYRIEISNGEAWRSIASSNDREAYDPKRTKRDLWTASKESKELDAEHRQVEEEIGRLSKVPVVYAGAFMEKPDATRRFYRGDPMQLRDEVEPAALSAVSIPFIVSSECAGVKLTDDQRRRLALARWITEARNPLTARVMVNRIWQHHFGEGLVSTPSDFGMNGARPSHPELLDWLAAEFMEHGWSVKHIQRLILESATYRQASDINTAAYQADAGARLLWRFPPQRIEAEVIRDCILQTSGKLDDRIGGPGFSFFEPNENYVRVYTPRQEWSPESFRRMIYGTVIRQRVDGVFGAFDCPDAGQIAPRRTSSVTPLQALNLLNSSFIMFQANAFAERLKREAGEKTERQIHRAFELAFQRDPAEQEITASLKLIHDGGLPLFCRALFNANEFIYLF